MNKSRRRFITALSIAICITLTALCAYVGYKFYKHEQSQNEKIQRLSGEISLLKGQIEEQKVVWDSDSYNYLAIGNSITRHGFAEYWWDDDRGMAASTDEKDYVHLVTKYLRDIHAKVLMHSVNFSVWETNYYDRAEFYSILDPYLSEPLSLITIQLGENASSLDTWESDWVELLSYIKGKAQKAEIYVIGDFWSNDIRDELKEQAALYSGVNYVSLDGIKDNSKYYAGLGTQVEGKDSDLHVIEHSGVAKHPGDNGMEAIAERIISDLR